MKKLLFLVLLLVVLGGLAYVAVTKDKSNNTTGMDVSDRAFAVENPDDIYKIFIATRNHDPITLTRKKGHWMVNDEFKAGDNQMVNLLVALRKAKVDHIPHPNATPNVIRDIGLVGIKVELYDVNDDMLKTFYIGNSTGDLMATYYLMDGASQPYAVKMPGFVGSMRGRFTLTAKDFRSMVFFEEKAEDIVSVSINYPRRQKDSFRINKEGDDYSVEPFHDLTKKIKKPISEPRIRAYLESFEKVACEYIDNENDGRDTIIEKLPFAILTVNKKSGEEKSMKIYSLNDLINGNTDSGDIESLNRVHRIFAECSWGDFLLIQMRNFKQLLRPYEHFFQ